MGTTTLIEWTDHTFNPWVGCTQISPGCANCYAKTDAPARIARSRRANPLELWGDDGARQIAKDWSAPVAWNRKAREEGVRRRVFCLSQGDVFEDRADLVAPRARLWKLIAETPHLDWLLLTKRPENASRLASLAALHAWDGGGPDAPTWLPNIWLGATVENQKMADERIPHLLGVPAKVRFLSCEPLLERVDLRGWGAAAPSIDMSQAPSTWAAFAWPDFIPSDVRSMIEKFWSESYGRGPRAWLEDHLSQGVPATGAVVPFRLDGAKWANVSKMPGAAMRGRYVHCWNNIGRIVTDDGKWFCCSSLSGSGWMSKWWLRKSDTYQAHIHWVIIGGESGPKARPCDVGWIRDLVSQCKAAGVAAFVKQLGAHPYDGRDANGPHDGEDAPCGIVSGGGDRYWFWLEHPDSTMHKQRDRKGGDPDEWPEDLRVREFPEPVEVTS